uniref:Uncharacterized protein n=1 Tax=Rhizophora mucronata TaxID=61149 RepID=A0A2P2NT43_RHIMU
MIENYIVKQAKIWIFGCL